MDGFRAGSEVVTSAFLPSLGLDDAHDGAIETAKFTSNNKERLCIWAWEFHTKLDVAKC